MNRTVHNVLALALVASAAASFPANGFSVVMARSSDPGEAGELVVFVGEQLSYEDDTMDCGDDCWVFDRWHKARYRVAEWVHGVPPGAEIEFSVAEHAPMVPFGQSRHALVFLEKTDDGFMLVKYQDVSVHPAAGGSFASCGPVYEEDANAPPLEDIVFEPTLVVDETARLSRDAWGELHDPRWHARVGDEIVCTRGVPVARIAPFMANRHPTLKAALPALAGGE